MRFRCTAKVERHSTGSDARRDTFRVRVGCLPLHEAPEGEPFRAMNVVVSTAAAGEKWSTLEQNARHRLVESFVRSYVKKRGVEWVSKWRPEVIEHVDVGEPLHDLLHDDPGDPFEITLP